MVGENLNNYTFTMCTGGGGIICVLCNDVCARVEVGLFVFCVMMRVHGWRWAYLCCVCNDVCAWVEVGLLYIHTYAVLLCALYCMYAVLLCAL